MKSFKEYLTEKWAAVYRRFDDLEHRDTIHGHDVQIQFSKKGSPYRTGKKRGSDWNIDFFVHGDSKKHHSMKPEHGKEILHHVHRVVKHFIDKKKPESIVMLGDTPKKNHLYHHFAKTLAKTHNVSIENYGSGTRVHFNDHMSESVDIDDLIEEAIQYLEDSNDSQRTL